MDYINFKGATRHLGAPPGWNDNPNNPPCGALVIRDNDFWSACHD